MRRDDVIWREQIESFELEITEIEGELPPGLHGLLLRNGAGQMNIGGEQLAFLDAYGMVAAVGFANGGARLRVVHPESSVRTRELAAGRMLERRPFTNKAGWLANLGRVTFETGTNHDTFVWAGAVHACDLGSHCTLSLPELSTVGERDWGDAVQKGEMIAPMPREDLTRGTLVAYALQQGPTGDRLSFVEVDERFGLVHRAPAVSLRGLVHDQAFSDRWYLAVESPVTIGVPALLWGRQPLWDTMKWRDEAPSLWLVPRGRDGEAVKIALPTELRTIFHILNAYDDGDTVVVDVIGYSGPVDFRVLMPSWRGKVQPSDLTNRVVRVVARPADGTATVTPFDGAAGEAPEVAPALHGRPYSSAWFAALPVPSSLAPAFYEYADEVSHLDVNTGAVTRWNAGESHQVSPPAFAHDPSSDDPEAGWLLVWDLDLQAETTDVVVLDAQAIDKGPVARLKLGVYLPATSHCRFAPGLEI